MTHGGAPHDPVTPRGVARGAPALAWLLGFADQERGVGWNPRAAPDAQWKLGRTRALLDLLGAPDRRCTCVLIAGTKGKGSTAAFLARILSAAGVRAGLYTQPHLQDYRERIRVDGVAITPDALADGVGALRPAVDALAAAHPEAGEPTTFELTTALALWVFARTGCRVAVLEVGLGGRLDATNAVEPAVSVITPISRDHLAILGPTLADVAREKAGILRRDRPAIIAPQAAEPGAALAAVAAATGARVLPPAPLAADLPLALAGAHQRVNAALAVAAAAVLPGIAVDPDAVGAGLATAGWPGRFEAVRTTPEVVLDGAHNDASAAALAATLRAHAAGRPITLVLGMHADKEAAAIVAPLCAIATRVIATAAAGPRARPAADVAAACRAAGTSAELAPTVAEAIGRARDGAAADAVIAVTGSLAVVGEARTALGLPVAERLW